MKSSDRLSPSTSVKISLKMDGEPQAPTIGDGENKIDRRALVYRHNPIRKLNNMTSPMQVGNGGFAFGVDITGLQTFVPFATMSEWAWKNDPLPTDQQNPQARSNSQSDLSGWLFANPNKMNLGRIGLYFENDAVTEEYMTENIQLLDLWSGTIYSSFKWKGVEVTVETTVHPEMDAISIKVDSPLILSRDLSIFVDFPYNCANYFAAPYVGDFNNPSAHTTSIKEISPSTCVINHSTDGSSYNVGFRWASVGRIIHLKDHRYVLKPLGSTSTFELSAFFDKEDVKFLEAKDISTASQMHWPGFWNEGGIIDLSESSDPRSSELERRIILSQYVTAVNCAGRYPPQESGLVNIGWYGKFHMEMYLWHSAHLALFNKWNLLDRSTSIYTSFLPSAIDYALSQKYRGARWPKMTDPSGRTSPQIINILLIWQQPHPLFFAELDYRAHPTLETLKKWKDILFATAEFMVSFTKWNKTSECYDLPPPLHIMSENTDYNVTHNPAFELQYWRFGLSIAITWWERIGLEPPAPWKSVVEKLAPLPVENGLYIMYEGIENMWKDFNWEHPSLSGIYGLLPSIGNLNPAIMKATTEKIWATWQLDRCWGWDFGMLAMNAARSGYREKAIEFLLHENFVFDDVGLAQGGPYVPAPYFPANGSLLYAAAFMAAGWEASEISDNAPGFPTKGWSVKHEDLSKAL